MQSTENDRTRVLLLIDDLIFISKISIAAKEAGVETRAINPQDLENLEELVDYAGLVIVDMNAEYIQPMECIRSLKKNSNEKDIRIIGFASHIQHDMINEAEQHPGVTVLPRSQFVGQLPGILQGVKQE